MLEYLLRRLLWAAVMVVVITLFTFITFNVIPGSQAQFNLPSQATQADVERRERFLGTDRPLYAQYAHFLWQLVGEQSLGRSFRTRQSVNKTVAAAAPVTAALVAGGAVMWMLVALPV